MTEAAWGALANLRVIDLSMMLAGPYCAMMLADQGADVIKVEPPQGDVTRPLGPEHPEAGPQAFGGYFQSVNRNKRSIALDLKKPGDREILLELVADADVLIENYRAGVMERLGLSYETLHALNPRLVYACLRGFGDPRSGVSPYVDWPAYDVVAQAMGGVMAITGPVGGPPTKVGPGVGDLVPAMMLAFGILAAVRHAEKTGEGQFVDLAMYDAVMALCERAIYQYSYTGVVAEPQGNGHPMLCPFGIFRTRDGWVSIAGQQDNFWALLCGHMERPELAADPDFATNSARVANSETVNGIVGEWTARHSQAEVAAMLGGSVPVGLINDARHIVEDPHVAARAMLVHVEQPGSGREAIIVNTPIHMSATPGGVRHRAPLLDEHRLAILADIERRRAAVGEAKTREIMT